MLRGDQLQRAIRAATMWEVKPLDSGGFALLRKGVGERDYAKVYEAPTMAACQRRFEQLHKAEARLRAGVYGGHG